MPARTIYVGGAGEGADPLAYKRHVHGLNGSTIRSFREVLQLRGHAKAVYSVTWSPAAHQIVSASGDRFLRVWDPNTGKPLRQLRGHSNNVFRVTFSPDGAHLVTCSDDKTLRLWDAKSGKCIYIMSGHTDGVLDCSWSPGGALIASGSKDCAVRLWDFKRAMVRVAQYPGQAPRPETECQHATCLGAPQGNKHGHARAVNAVAWSPDERYVVSCSDDTMAKMWDARKNLKFVRSFEGHHDCALGATFTHDGRLLATCSHDKSIRVWESDTGRCLRRLEKHKSIVYSLRMSPVSGDRLMLSCGHDGLVVLWDIHSGEVVFETFGTHRAWILDVAWAPDGLHYVSASADNTLKVFQGQQYFENIFYRGMHRAQVIALALVKEVRLQLGV